MKRKNLSAPRAESEREGKRDCSTQASRRRQTQKKAQEMDEKEY